MCILFDKLRNRLNETAFAMILTKFIIFVIVFAVSNIFTTSILTYEIKTNVSKSYALTLNSVSNTVNQMIEQFVISSHMTNLSPEIFELFYDETLGADTDPVKTRAIIDSLAKYENISSLVEHIAIVDRKTGSVYTSSGKSAINTFFGISNIYDNYPVKFWNENNLAPYGYETLPPTVKNGKRVIPVIVGAETVSKQVRFMVIDIDCRILMERILSNLSEQGSSKNPGFFLYNSINDITISNRADDREALFKNQAFKKTLQEKDSFTYRFGGAENLVVKVDSSSNVMKDCTYVSIISMEDLMRSSLMARVLIWVGIFLADLLLLLFAFRSSQTLYKPFSIMKGKIANNSSASDHASKNEVEFILQGIDNIISKSDNMSKELAAIMPLAVQQYLMKFLENYDEEQCAAVEGYLNRNGFEWKEEGFVAAHIRMRFSEKFYNDFTKDEYESIIHNIEEYFAKLFMNDYESIVLSYRKDTLVLIVNIPAEQKAYNKVKSVLEDATYAFNNDKEQLIVRVALSGLQTGYEGMCRAYNESRNIGVMQLNSYESGLNVANGTPDADANIEYSIDDDNRIYHCIIKGDREETEKTVDLLLQKNVDKGIDEFRVKQLYKNIYLTVIKAIKTKNVSEKALMQEKYKETDVYFEMSDIEDLTSYVKTLLYEAVSYSNMSATGLDMHGVVGYIDANYMKDIYLESVAEKFGTTSKYLSKVFKQYTGVNFAEYVVGLKINEAKRLLSSTDDKINDIYLKCGFYSRNTFVRNFKAYVGVLPNEYRKMAKEEKK